MRQPLQKLLLFTAALGLAVAIGAGRLLAQVPALYTVSITSSGFTPSDLTVARSATVTWINNDSVTHAISSTNAAGTGPNSGQLGPGRSYTFTFNRLGPFIYQDPFSKGMTGTVTVVTPNSPGITPLNSSDGINKGTTSTPTENNGTSATGPVATGDGSGSQPYVPAIIVGVILLAGAGALLISRRTLTAPR